MYVYIGMYRVQFVRLPFCVYTIQNTIARKIDRIPTLNQVYAQ
jgi:hypothetical protein